jgi:hypothetical protein
MRAAGAAKMVFCVTSAAAGAAKMTCFTFDHDKVPDQDMRLEGHEKKMGKSRSRTLSRASFWTTGDL